MPLKKIAVMASGRGSNFAEILSAIDRGEINAQVCALLVNQSNTGVQQKAQAKGIPTYSIRKKDYDSQEAFDIANLNLLKKLNPDLIVMAGYMSIIGGELIKTFKNRMINIHPSLLPAFGGEGFYGRHVHQAVLDYGCKVSGATVHFVVEEVDAGPIILQECVPVYDDDTPESLAARVAIIEHKILPKAVQLFIDGKIIIHGRIAKQKKNEEDA